MSFEKGHFKPKKACIVCGKLYPVNNYGRHLATHDPEEVARAEKAAKLGIPYGDTDEKPAPKPKSKFNGTYEEEEPAVIHQPTLARPQSQVHTLRSEVPMTYIDCPHCEGVLIIGEEKVDHINDLRAFLKSVAPTISSAVVRPVPHTESREQADPYGTEEGTRE